MLITAGIDVGSSAVKTAIVRTAGSGQEVLALRVHRHGSDYLVEAATEGGHWSQIRLAHLHEGGPGGTVAAGLYACSPKGAGFVAEFDFLRIEQGRAG